MYKYNPEYPINSWNNYFNNNKELLNQLWAKIKLKSENHMKI